MVIPLSENHTKIDRVLYLFIIIVDGSALSMGSQISKSGLPIVNEITCRQFSSYHLSLCNIATTTNISCSSHENVMVLECRRSMLTAC